jgi:hypothetical protein
MLAIRFFALFVVDVSNQIPLHSLREKDGLASPDRIHASRCKAKAA